MAFTGALTLLVFCLCKSLLFISSTVGELLEHTTEDVATYSLLAVCKVFGPSVVSATWNLWGLWHGDTSIPPLPVQQPGVEDANWWDHYIYIYIYIYIYQSVVSYRSPAGVQNGVNPGPDR